MEGCDWGWEEGVMNYDGKVGDGRCDVCLYAYLVVGPQYAIFY